ncbi:MAG: hypothetical protein IKL49_09935 [Lachnospiraceae bacterium]|nr:hypothetical protein [Lachnospiraceae bacterium]
MYSNVLYIVVDAEYKEKNEGIGQLLLWSDFIKEHCSILIDVETVTIEEYL